MSQNWFNINERHSSNFVGNLNQEIFKKDKSGFPEATNIIFPPTNSEASWLRHKPATQVPTSFDGSSLDIWVNPAGFTKRFIADMTVSNTGVAAINVLPHYLFLRIEYLDSQMNVLSTFKADSIYLELIHKSYEDVLRLSSSEGITVTTFNSDDTLAVGASREYFLHLPSFIDATEQVLNSVKDNRFCIRFCWISSLGMMVFIGLGS